MSTTSTPVRREAGGGARPAARRVLAAAAGLLAAVLALGPGAVQAQASACNCSDLRDLMNRICEARAAVSEYRKQINLIRAAEQRRGAPLMHSEAIYRNDVQPCVQEAINQVTDSGARRGTAETDNSCNLSFKSPPPTACMRGSLTAHESVHVTYCQAIRNERDGFFQELRDTFRDIRSDRTMVDLLNEERAAYTTEISYARMQLDRLARSGRCPELTRGNPQFNERWLSGDPCPPPRPRPPQAESPCMHR